MPKIYDTKTGMFVDSVGSKTSIEIGDAATVLIKGDKGDSGIPPKIISGSGQPNINGTAGDLYLDTETGDVYSYV